MVIRKDLQAHVALHTAVGTEGEAVVLLTVVGCPTTKGVAEFKLKLVEFKLQGSNVNVPQWNGGTVCNDVSRAKAQGLRS